MAPTAKVFLSINQKISGGKFSSFYQTIAQGRESFIHLNERALLKPYFHRSLLPLQVDSIGLWVYVFLQVVTEVYQHLEASTHNTKHENNTKH